MSPADTPEPSTPGEARISDARAAVQPGIPEPNAPEADASAGSRDPGRDLAEPAASATEPSVPDSDASARLHSPGPERSGGRHAAPAGPDELPVIGVEPAADAGLLPAVATRPRWLLVLLAAVCAAALLAAGGAVAVIGGLGGHRTPADDSVDAGFARDMMVHHQQAVQMAGWVRDHDTNPEVRLVAYDIETQQLTEVGLFEGWLDGWGLLANTDRNPMGWMVGQHVHLQSGGLMPGMATTAELDKLRTLSGRELEVSFLQLMIRHHQGGIPMAQYAADHAGTGYVRAAAKKMADAQSIEVVNMERMLRDLGGTPLPPPD